MTMILNRTAEIAEQAMYKANRDSVMATVYAACDYIGEFKDAKVQIVTHDAHQANDARMLFISLLGLPSNRLTDSGDGFSFVKGAIAINSIMFGKESQALAPPKGINEHAVNFAYMVLGKLSKEAESILERSNHQVVYFNSVVSVAA